VPGSNPLTRSQDFHVAEKPELHRCPT
jgi:hypothetical protein